VPPKAKPAAPRPKPLSTAAVVTVVDGNTNARVPGARVTVGPRSRVTDGNGVARVWLRRRAPLVTKVRAPGYPSRTLRLAFQRHQRSTVRVYRQSLQWPMYGANARRTQSQAQIRLRPPFRVVWSRGVGSLAEFPAVVSDGVAYITNFRGTVHAFGWQTGSRSGARRRPTGRWPPRRPCGAIGSSSTG
jgi:hypothetical protein